MKLLGDLVAGVAAAGVSFWVASAILAPTPPDRVAQGRSSSLDERAAPSTGSAPSRADSAAVRATAVTRSGHPDPARAEPADDLRTVQQRASMSLLRNEVIRASTEDMTRRGVSVTSCLDGVRLSGQQKIRFAVDVESTADQAITGTWRFVEIVDGEPIPASFAACAARALGSGHRVTPRRASSSPRTAASW